MPAEINASQQYAGSNPVAAAIQKASQATGVGFDYLINTAMRESSLNTQAQAKTSSAAGLFQFIEQTWLGAVKAYGDRHGLGNEAAAITKDKGGVYRVADSVTRDAILNLRFDATASAALAGELAGENKQLLERHLGRAASAADLYAAHFLGPSGAVKLLSAASNLKAADILPAAAKSNAHVFYEGSRAKSVGEVVSSIAESMGIDVPGKKVPQQGTESASSFVPSVGQRQSASPSEKLYQDQAVKISDPIRLESRSKRESAPMISAKLSMVAMSVLQALDPTRLGASRNESDRNRF